MGIYHRFTVIDYMQEGEVQEHKSETHTLIKSETHTLIKNEFKCHISYPPIITSTHSPPPPSISASK